MIRLRRDRQLGIVGGAISEVLDFRAIFKMYWDDSVAAAGAKGDLVERWDNRHAWNNAYIIHNNVYNY